MYQFEQVSTNIVNSYVGAQVIWYPPRTGTVSGYDTPVNLSPGVQNLGGGGGGGGGLFTVTVALATDTNTSFLD